jgi:plastocyanin
MKAASLALTVGALLAVGGAQAQTAQPLTVSMTSYAFTPSTLTLKAGQTYRIHFRNDATKSHDFAAREFFASSTIAPEDRAKVTADGEVEFEGGQSAEVTLTPNRAGTYPLTCTHFMHSMLGMSGKIVVQ